MESAIAVLNVVESRYEHRCQVLISLQYLNIWSDKKKLGASWDIAGERLVENLFLKWICALVILINFDPLCTF